MAGTLVITTLSDGTNSTSSTNCIQGSAKAWVYFAGATGTISGSYNVSSVTRAAVGSYVINMTNALSSANYAVVGSQTRDASTNSLIASNNQGQAGAYTQTASAFGYGVTTYNISGWADPVRVSVAAYSS